MNEQIIVTQYDKGIKINIGFKDNKKVPVDITGCSVEVQIVQADNNKLNPFNAIITNATLGECYFILTEEHTEQIDLCSCYIKAIDDYNNIHAQDSIYYFVLPLNGGVN